MSKKRMLFAVALLSALALVSGACGTEEEGGGQAAGCSAEPLQALGSSVDRAPSAKDFKLAAARKPPRVLGQAKETVKIGFIGDLTGGNASLIISSHKSAALAVEKANEAGDLPVTLELFTIDNKDAGTDPAPTADLVDRFVDDEAVVGVVGPGFSGETESGGPDLDAAELTFISPSATNPDLTKKGWKAFFRALATDAVQGGQTGQLIVDVLGCTKVAIIDDKSPYGAGLADAVEQSVKDEGGTVLREGIEPTTDYRTAIDTVMASDHEVLYYAGYDKEAPLVAKQYRDSGGEGLFMGGDGDKGTNFLNEGGEAAEGAIITCPCLDPNASDDAAAQQFAEDYKAFGTQYEDEGAEAGIYSSESWDATSILIAAIKDAGADVTRESVLDYVTNLKDYKGLSKTFNWTPEHEVEEGEITFVYVVRDGRFTLGGRIDELAAAAGD